MANENLVPSISVMVLSLFLLAASTVGFQCVRDKDSNVNKRFLKSTIILSIVGILVSLIIMYMSSQ